jgi:hypothetical protein
MQKITIFLEILKWVTMFFLKVKVKISSLRLGCCPKLVARYCGPFEILEKIGPIVYMITLPTSMRVNNVFHVLLLKKYVPDSNHIIDWTVIHVENEGIFGWNQYASWTGKSRSQEKIHRDGEGSMDPLRSEDATWEHEESMWEEYPYMFANFEGNIN